IKLREGNGKASVWGCDLTYDYVKINGDYRS
ncbi:MAG: bifunctional ornithine acetyltransferase/N-acetylglutamate synthase, partial [Spirochaetes bacterium]|nr:bifunctional ornithine acetyltransferase/N-acetylglutamate synthase [Spirochaetota bacterium]